MTTIPAPTTQQPSISTLSDADLIKNINEKITSMLYSFKTSVTHAMDVGDLLLEAKGRAGHGNFEAWLATHCQLSFRTARRYMGMAKNRVQIEAQLAAKSAKVADLNAQGLLTDQSGGAKDKPSGAKGKAQTAAGDYDALEEKLIDKLKELDPNEARDHADKTIAALNDTVADIASIAKRAATKAAKLGAVVPPSQA
jgi:DUF3102 family protein